MRAWLWWVIVITHGPSSQGSPSTWTGRDLVSFSVSCREEIKMHWLRSKNVNWDTTDHLVYWFLPLSHNVFICSKKENLRVIAIVFIVTPLISKSPLLLQFFLCKKVKKMHLYITTKSSILSHKFPFFDRRSQILTSPWSKRITI